MIAAAASRPETSTPTKTEEFDDDDDGGDDGDLVSWKQGKQAQMVKVIKWIEVQNWQQQNGKCIQIIWSLKSVGKIHLL